MRQITKWLSEKPYTKAMYITALATIVMAVMSAIMCWTVVQNRRTLDMAAKSLSLQEKEFKLRNRPLVDITEARFGGPGIDDSDGKQYPRTVELRIMCISDVPASQFKALCEVMLNDQRVATTTINLGALAKGKSWMAGVYLTEDIYLAATNKNNRFWIDIAATYSGMLGEAPTEYETSFVLKYNPILGEFGFSERKYK